MLASVLVYIAASNTHFIRLQFPLSPYLPKQELRGYSELAWTLGAAAKKARLGELKEKSFNSTTYTIHITGTDGRKLAAIAKSHLPSYVPPGSTLHIRHGTHEETTPLP